MESSGYCRHWRSFQFYGADVVPAASALRMGVREGFEGCDGIPARRGVRNIIRFTDRGVPGDRHYVKSDKEFGESEDAGFD